MAQEGHFQEEIYTHEHLWRSGEALLRAAGKQKEGSYYHLLPALLMSFLAYEAFINFCGYVALPHLWNDEKTNFKGKGIEAKLETIIGELKSFIWEKGKRPYQTIKNLESFRDLVAHGKVQAREYVAEIKEDGTHYEFEHAWDTYVDSPQAVKKFREEIKLFCDSLLVELRKRSDHPHLIFDAFEGSLASGSGTVKLQ